MDFVTELIIIFFMILFNAIFAAYEMALASISRSRLTYLVYLKRRGAEDALHMKDQMEASLAVVQVGITLVGAVAAATGGAGVIDSFKPILMAQFGMSDAFAEILSLTALIIPLSVMTIIFAELIPKTYALRNKEEVCLALSRTMRMFASLAYPVVLILERTVKAVMRFLTSRDVSKKSLPEMASLHELTAALSLARTARLIGPQQERIVLSAAQLSHRPIKEIMLPKADISMIPLNSTLTDALIKAHLDMHTRFPVCEADGNPQTIVGYINFKDIIATLKMNPSDPGLKGIVRPIKKVEEDMLISKVLEEMIRDRLHIVLVANARGEVTGMVTLEDIIEELIGDIEDEFDRLPGYIHPYGENWIMGGAVTMLNVARTVGIDWPASPETNDLKLADWCQKHLPGALQGGETIKADGLSVMVRKLRRKKVSEAVVGKI